MRFCRVRQQERGVKIWTAREAVADGLTQAQYVCKVVGVVNPYANKGSEQHKRQKRWRKQQRIDYIIEQQRVWLCPDLLEPDRPAEEDP